MMTIAALTCYQKEKEAREREKEKERAFERRSLMRGRRRGRRRKIRVVPTIEIKSRPDSNVTQFVSDQTVAAAAAVS